MSYTTIYTVYNCLPGFNFKFVYIKFMAEGHSLSLGSHHCGLCSVCRAAYSFQCAALPAETWGTKSLTLFKVLHTKMCVFCQYLEVPLNTKITFSNMLHPDLGCKMLLGSTPCSPPSPSQWVWGEEPLPTVTITILNWRSCVGFHSQKSLNE